jgi:hypothetical protein
MQRSRQARNVAAMAEHSSMGAKPKRAKFMANVNLSKEGVNMGKLEEAKARPGLWKESIQPQNGHGALTIPETVEDALITSVGDGKSYTELEELYQLNRGTVRQVLIRRFGSIEQMRKALEHQCLENAIVLNEHAFQNVGKISPGQALVGAKIMIDGAIALSKVRQDRPPTVDFDSLAALGSVLDRVEKRLDADHAREV